MATLITKNSSTASSVPSAAQLVQGELAVNVTDKRLFTENASGTVVELGTNPSSVTLPNGTANGLAFLNASKVLTTGSALTFDGTNFGVGGSGDPFGRFYGRSVGLSSASSAFLELNAATGSTSGIDFGVNATRTAGITSNTTETNFTTLGATPLLFGIGGSEQMRLTSTGLGIGTSSPSRKLTVYGSNNTTNFEVAGASGGASFNIYNNTTSNAVAIGTNASTMSFGLSGSDRMFLTTAGNLGLGVTPSAWGSAWRATQIGTTGFIAGRTDAERFYAGSNGYYNGTNWIYTTTGRATYYASNVGQHEWYTAPSGTAGNAISFTQAMTLDASGNLLVGTTSGVAYTSRMRLQGGLEIHGAQQHNVAPGNTNPYEIVNRSGGGFDFYPTGSTLAARIDSSGNLIHSAPTTPPTLSTNGTMVFNLTSNTNLRISVRGSDGVTRTANITLA